MNSTISTSENQRKPTVLVLRNAAGARLSLRFFLALAEVDTVYFDCEYELDNWLRHCVEVTTPILAVIVDADHFARSSYRIDAKGTLALRRIPLLVVGTEHYNRDWCRLDGDWQNGRTLYLLTINLLPQLLKQLSGERSAGDLHGKDLEP